MGGPMVEFGAGRVLAFAAVIVVSLGSTWSGSAVASDDSASGEPRETTQRRVHGTITAVNGVLVTIAPFHGRTMTGRIDPKRTRIDVDGKRAGAAGLEVPLDARGELSLDDVWISIRATSR